ncbi:Carbohydrate esterase 4 protein [Ceratobasidium sp. 414]|nr:Carbohydrate esterase 4 protein [Ceratobasidium sp. 414]
MVFSVVRLTVLAAALFGAVSATPIETPKIEARAAAKVITKCTQPKTIAFTFDDGPYIYNKKIVDTLTANGAKGTFFVNGNNYGCIYDQGNVDRLKYAYGKGHQIASHTWSHAHLTQISSSQLTSEFTKTNTALKKTLGIEPAFMRPPYGEYNSKVQNEAGKYGQSVVIWDFDSGDSVGKTASQSKNLYKSLIGKNPNNVLTLNHETYASTANDVLPYAIQLFKAKGYKMVTVAECLGQSPYKSTGSPGKRDSTWKC